MIEEAERLSEAGEAETAAELFGLALLDIQSGLLARAETRAQALGDLEDMDERAVSAFTPFRLWSYAETGASLDLVRRMLAHHARLEREAHESGNPGGAAEIRNRGRALRQLLVERYTVGSSARIITMEATGRTDRRRGPGYTLHGRRGREEFVTPLPGEPRPDELGRHPFYSATIAEVLETVGAQEDFLTELLRHPELRAEFGSGVLDLNDLDTRIRIWRAAYAVFEARPSAGCGTSLCSLLRLMERFLRAFTTHTGYDIRDFGVSYLASDFPEDLLGRVVRDCGVYAVSVAYEVYRTARAATPRLPVSFQLYHTLEHVMLVIVDEGDGSHYVLNNDRIEGPRTGDPAGSVAESYAGLMGRAHLLSVGGRLVPLGTGLSEAAFRRRLWQTYRAGTRLALEVEPPAGPDDFRTESERVEASHVRYYEAMARFDVGGGELHGRIDHAVERLAATPEDRHPELIETLLAEPTRIGVAMARIFGEYVLDPQRVGLRRGPNVSVERIALVTSGPSAPSHPLVRLGKLLLFAERVRGAATSAAMPPDQQTLLRWIGAVPIPSFGAELADYDRQGRPPRF